MKKLIAILLSFILSMSLILPASALSSIAVKGIKLDTSKVTLKVGQTYNLKVTLTPKNTTQKRLTYVTGNKNIATIDATGKIKGVSKGTTTITVYTYNKKIFAKCNVTITPLVEVKKKEPVVISIWSTMERFNKDDRQDKIPYKKDLGYIEEKLGVKLKITEVPQGQYEEAVKIMLSTNSLTDIICVSSVFDVKPGDLFANKQIIPINKYENSMKNYKKLLDEYPALKKNVVDDKGNVLYFSNPCIEAELSLDGGLMIRKDWLDKLGLRMPDTVEDWVTVLKAFRDKDPNGNGQADELPYVGSRGSLETLANYFFGVQEGFGMKGGGGGEVVFGPFEAVYKERLKFMHMMFTEKLVNQNYLNADGKMRDSWMLGDKAGSTLTGLNAMGKWNILMEKHPTFLMWPVANPTYKGVRYFDKVDIPKMSRNGGTYVTTLAKNPEKCVEFIDYFFGDEGHLLRMFGVEGITYKMDRGFPQFTDLILKNPDGLSIADAISKYIGIPGSMSYDDMRRNAQMSLNTPAQRQAIMKTWPGVFNEKTNSSLPPAIMTVEESTEYADIMGDINTYVKESVNKFVQGILSVDKDYDKFVSELKKMKAERALEIQKAAVKRWQTRGGFDYKFVMKRADIKYWDKLDLSSQRGINVMDPDLK